MRVEPSTLDRFWLRMAAMFGHSWVSQYGPAPDGIGADTWSAVLADLSPQQIGMGLQTLARIPSDWPPTAPKFRALCLGIPSLAQVRVEMRSGNPDPSPFARLLWSYLDGYAYRRAEIDKADRMLRDAYELAAAFVMEGGAMPAASEKLEQDKPEPPKAADPETAQRYIDEIAKIFGAKDVATDALNDPPAPTIQDHFADLERESMGDFHRAAG